MSQELTPEEQSAVLAGRYSQRAEAYDALWSPVILPAAQRLLAHLPLSGARNIVDVGTGAGALLPLILKGSPDATVLGVDNSEGMLQLARKKHTGPLKLMDVQKLELPNDQFDVAVVAFVLFHLPRPDRCLQEVTRVLRPGGAVGTVTWGPEDLPAQAVWDEELDASGANVPALPAVDNRGSCDTPEKVAALLNEARLESVRTWTEPIHRQWRPDEHFQYEIQHGSRLRLLALSPGEREGCVQRICDRLSGAAEDQFLYQAQVVMATALKPRRG